MGRNASLELSVGAKFGKLTIIELHHKDKRWRRFYRCQCDCGKEAIVQGSLLTSGNTRSCGCLLREAANKRRLPNNKGVINHLILQYKRHARDRGFKFDLDYPTFASLIQQPCHYCGQPSSNNKVTKNCTGFIYSGIDRLLPSLGYIKDNVVPCCAICNIAKKDLNKKDFLEWIDRVYKHNHKDAMANQWGKT